jgi:hypothetical protein
MSYPTFHRLSREPVTQTHPAPILTRLADWHGERRLIVFI